MGERMKQTSYGIVVTLITLAFINTASASIKVTQAALVNFKTHKDVLAVSIEEFKKPLRLLLLGEDNEVIFSTQFRQDWPPREGFSYANPLLRFKVLHIKGLPSPMIFAVAVFPGGSDIGYAVKMIGEKNGKIATLSKDAIDLSIQNGVYLGYINRKYGYGMITWEFQWEEAHYDPHKYKIKIYTWDSRKHEFIHKVTLTTKKKFSNGCSAVRHCGLPCKNFRDKVLKPEEEISTLGIEKELLKQNESGP